ncbi:MAG TPA: flagellar hook-basal body protein [Candidatus Coprocola pullicola]|nr:flagellar hook-basal body protein [Candidatus Coprocola pullicola]
MSKGFYDLTSSMLTQNRHLAVIGNNITNAATPGFKTDEFIASTFQDEMFSRYGNINHEDGQELGTTLSMATAGVQTVTDFSQGIFEQTGMSMDFALTGNGFFQLQGEEGVVYTRNGSFIIDDEGYLSLPHGGRVLGEDNQPIYLGTDDIQALPDGTILTGDGNVVLARLGIVDFEDYATLQKSGDEGLFITTGAQPVPTDTKIEWQTLEKSNVDMVKEMTDMMSSQRALQSAAQVLKMYDQLLGKATTEIGRV